MQMGSKNYVVITFGSYVKNQKIALELREEVTLDLSRGTIIKPWR